MRSPFAALALVAALAAAPVPAGAWGFEVHKLITDRAIDLLPPELRPFFDANRTFVVEHSIDPDLWRTAGFGDEPPRHFVDMDAYGEPPFPDLPREYDRAIARYGADFVHRNGTLPWRTAEFFGNLRRAFDDQRAGRRYARENVRFHAAVLSHYIADAHVPFHAVANYDGQLTGQHGIHHRWETELVLRQRDRLTLAPPPVVAVTDPRGRTFEVLLESFSLVEDVLAADRDAIAGRDVYDDEYYAIMARRTGPVMEARLAAAASAVAGMIVGAWEAAGRPALPVTAPRQPERVRPRTSQGAPP